MVALSSRLRRTITLRFPSSFQPPALPDPGLEVRCDARSLRSRTNHGTSHLVPVGVDCQVISFMS